MNTKSRKSIKPSKSAPASTKPIQPAKPAKPGTVPDATQNNLARIHDLTGVAVISIPAELRGLIGDEAYKRHLANVEVHDLVLIVREPHDVVYIRMPIMAMSAEPHDPASQEAAKAPARTGAKVKAKSGVKAAAKPSTDASRKTRGSP